MNCVGGSNDGRTFPVRQGARHGQIVEVPILRASTADWGNVDALVPIYRKDVIELYRVFEFHLDGRDGICLVTEAWSDEDAWGEVKALLAKSTL